MKYANALLSRNCAEELVTLFGKTHNPIKEITESYGALHHMKGALNRDKMLWNDMLNFHIGDGSTARTGALFTFLTKSANISIDPNTNADFIADWSMRWGVENFNAYKCVWQDYRFKGESLTGFGKDLKRYNKPHYNLIMVHSHVNTADVMNAFPDWTYAYVNPCCQLDAQILSTKYIEGNDIDIVMAGRDTQILSERNQVFVYRNNKMFERFYDLKGIGAEI